MARRAVRKVSKEARTAGIRRALKFTAFSIVGTVLANAAALAATALVGIDAPLAIVSVVSLLAGSVAAGVQKSISWKDTGVEMPPPTTPTLQFPIGGPQ